MYSAWLAREIVKKGLMLLSTSPTVDSNADSSWLETYWTSSKPFVMPETSTSSVTTNGSNKKNQKHALNSCTCPYMNTRWKNKLKVVFSYE